MKKSQIALGVAAAFGVTMANAAVVSLTLVGAAGETTSGSSLKAFNLSTATWSYNTTTDILTASGFYKEQTQIAPFVPGSLFTHNITNLSVGGGGSASATSYDCIEGSFGGGVFASLCGNYNYGANYVNEGTATWGPGTAHSKTPGGDDVQLGSEQSVNQNYDGMSGTWNGTTLLMSNVVPFLTGSSITLTTISAIPVPAAAWLFGSALGLLGWVRRRA